MIALVRYCSVNPCAAERPPGSQLCVRDKHWSDIKRLQSYLENSSNSDGLSAELWGCLPYTDVLDFISVRATVSRCVADCQSTVSAHNWSVADQPLTDIRCRVGLLSGWPTTDRRSTESSPTWGLFMIHFLLLSTTVKSTFKCTGVENGQVIDLPCCRGHPWGPNQLNRP